MKKTLYKYFQTYTTEHQPEMVPFSALWASPLHVYTTSLIETLVCLSMESDANYRPDAREGHKWRLFLSISGLENLKTFLKYRVLKLKNIYKV
jgi:hypothetical protein